MSDANGPPVLIGEKVWWLGSGSGLPKKGVVRWIGRLPEIGPDWALGIELEESLPYGGVDGSWRGRQLFKCKPKHGLIVPSDRVLAHQSGGGSLDTARKAAALLPLHNQVAAPPRLKRYQGRNLLLDRHSDFRSVHLEAVQIRRRFHEDQLVSLVLGQASTSTGDVVPSRGMSRTDAANLVISRPRRTESLAARKEKTNSGLFSFLRWFKKENKTDKGEERSSFSNPSSPVLRRSDNAVTGSVDTLFSTATATSFSYVHPDSYRPFGEASEPKKWIFPGPETNTYRNRIKERDELKNVSKNLSLRRKYNLYASGSLGRSLDEIFSDLSSDSLDRLDNQNPSYLSSLAKKKRKAPSPPLQEDSLNLTGCDSLPTTLSKESLDDFKLHRRAVSESAKYKKKLYHVKGKRRAPPPPVPQSLECDPTSDLNSSGNTLRKKRKAPPPPSLSREGNIINIPKESTLDIIQTDKLKIDASHLSTPSTSRTTEQEEQVESISSTDTLRLEKGILKPNIKDKEIMEPKPIPTSPVSPRPWYKRPQSSGSSPKQNEWKKKETKSIDDWMLESGFPRRSQGLLNDSRFSIFGKNDRPDDKRRSQISILTNISELDREAAEIIQRGKEREKSLLASYNAKYYLDHDDKSSRLVDEGSQTDAVPKKKATAKELISLFNSITNVRMTVNSNFAPQQENKDVKTEAGQKMYDASLQEFKNKNIDKKPISARKIDESILKDNLISTKTDVATPGPSRSRNSHLIENKKTPECSDQSTPEETRISRVTIEELDEYDSEKSKSQAITKENEPINNYSSTQVASEISENPTKSSSGSTICSSLLNDSNSSLSSTSSTGAKIRSSHFFSHTPFQKKLNLWKCSRCTLENPRWRLTCEACDTWRPTVCDYKLCKKTYLPEESTALIADSKGKKDLIDPKNDNSKETLDQETKNIIRNGQVLSNLVSQGISSRSKDLNKTKPNSPNNSKKILLPKECLNSKDHIDNINKNLSAVSNIPIPSNGENNDGQMELVRKARIAFFNKSDTKVDHNISSITNNESINYMDNISKVTTNDKLKLRELLKEMKNSLPKQKKILHSPSSSNHSELQTAGKTVVTKEGSLEELALNSDTLNKCYVEKEDNTTNKSIIKENNDIHPVKEHLLSSSSSDETTFRPSYVKTSFLHKNDSNLEHKKNSETKIDDKSSNNQNKFVITKPVIVNTVAKSFNIENSSNKEPNKLIKNANTDQLNGVTPESSNNKKTPDTLESKNEKKAEAILVKSEIVIEKIKMKKKPEKVSSSAQTSTKVLSLDDDSKLFPKNKETIVPVVTEEYNLHDDGSRTSSVHTEPMVIDVKKFELMRPRDFTATTSSFEALGNKTTNNLEVTATPTASSSGSSLQNLNLEINEPMPGPSTAKGEGVADMGTLALNRLLRKLESAISGGQHDAAAILAKELARLKVPCSVVRQPSPAISSTDILINITVENKTSQKGSISISVKSSTTLSELKKKMLNDHSIPLNTQRWFIDKKLANDDLATMKQLGIQGPTTPVYLYLITAEIAEKEIKNDGSEIEILKDNIEITDKVDTENTNREIIHSENDSATLPSTQSLGWKCYSCSQMNKNNEKTCKVCSTPISRPKEENKQSNGNGGSSTYDNKIQVKAEDPQPSTSFHPSEQERKENYERLVALERDELVVSIVSFECPVCFIECIPPEGVVLRECLHSFCRACLSKTVEYSEEAEIKCPFRDDTYTCNSTLLEREIKALVTPQVYEEHLAKSIAQAETKIANAFHCKTPDCKGWCIYEDNVNLFKCPVCLYSNCLTCQAIHDGLDCKQYQEQLNQDSEVNLEAKRTKDMLQEMVDRGEAMPCPRCKVVLMKKWGCDWLRCSMCKTEICWVTRGHRWGPNGKGDTSGGCQCGVNGVKCHPKCNYCH